MGYSGEDVSFKQGVFEITFGLTLDLLCNIDFLVLAVADLPSLAKRAFAKQLDAHIVVHHTPRVGAANDCTHAMQGLLPAVASRRCQPSLFNQKHTRSTNTNTNTTKPKNN